MIIFKVQMPVVTNDPNAEALLYNKERTIEGFVPITSELLHQMRGEKKKYFFGDYEKGEVDLQGQAPDQDW